MNRPSTAAVLFLIVSLDIFIFVTYPPFDLCELLAAEASIAVSPLTSEPGVGELPSDMGSAHFRPSALAAIVGPIMMPPGLTFATVK